jgi:hypothetical protein
MSSIVTTGKLSPNGLPVSELIDIGPVDPLQPPMTLEQSTKNLFVSKALPGPMQSSHQPGSVSSGVEPGRVGVARQRVADQDRCVSVWRHRLYASVIRPSLTCRAAGSLPET